jgi:hypothetical protein
VITYRGHIVYVIWARYPEIADPRAVQRVATSADLLQPTTPLGILLDGKCVPLSPYEAARVGS